MFPLLIPMLAGAAGGALLNKKDPLKGALLGGGLAAGGGALLGAGASAGAMGAGTVGGAGAAVPGAVSQGGLLGGFSQYAKPIGDAAATANQVGGLLSQPQQQMPQAQLPQYQDMSGLLATAQQNPQLAQLQAQRAKRRGLLGGNYG